MALALERIPTRRHRRSGLYLIFTIGIWSLFFLVQQRAVVARLSTSLPQPQSVVESKPKKDDIRSTLRTTTSSSNNETIHVLFGLKGKDAAFLAEFQVALKNVLLQAPLEQPMHIHIMADEDAFRAITVDEDHNKDPLYAFVPSLQWSSIQPIQIHVYNVQQQLEETWTPFLRRKFQSYSFQRMTGHHTVGAFFRLLAHQVLLQYDPTIQYVIYLDPDVIVLANLQALWKERPIHDPHNLFAWGERMCSGMLLLNLQRLDLFWKLTDTLKLPKIAKQYKQVPNDQLFLRAMNVTYPETVALLPDAWDINIADGIWKYAKTIVQERPQIAMMHFNGGPNQSPEPYFKAHSFLKPSSPELVETWGIALYYARMPWTWARYLTEQQIPVNRPSYPLKVYLYPSSSCLTGNCTTNAL